MIDDPRSSVTKPRSGAAVLYLIILAAVTGCNDEPTGRDVAPQTLGGALVAVVGPSEGHPQWPGIRGGVQHFLAGAPSLRAYCAAPADERPESLKATVVRVLERRPAIVCLYVVDAETVRPTIDLFSARQTILLTTGEPCSYRRIAGHVDVDVAGAAELLGTNLAQLAAGRQSYLLLHDGGRNAQATNCYQRFSAAVQRRYEMTLLRAASTAQSQRTAAQLVEEMLEQFPHAGLFVTLTPDVWLTARAGWNQRLRALNPTFRFATISAAPILWRRLGTPGAPGEAAALVGPLDGDIGYALLKMATQFLLSSERPATAVTIPCEVVTPETLPDFAARYSVAANGLDVSEFLPAPTSNASPPE